MSQCNHGYLIDMSDAARSACADCLQRLHRRSEQVSSDITYLIVSSVHPPARQLECLQYAAAQNFPWRKGVLLESLFLMLEVVRCNDLVLLQYLIDNQACKPNASPLELLQCMIHEYPERELPQLSSMQFVLDNHVFAWYHSTFEEVLTHMYTKTLFVYDIVELMLSLRCPLPVSHAFTYLVNIIFLKSPPNLLKYPLMRNMIRKKLSLTVVLKNSEGSIIGETHYFNLLKMVDEAEEHLQEIKETVEETTLLPSDVIDHVLMGYITS